jgi:hypothetical protein
MDCQRPLVAAKRDMETRMRRTATLLIILCLSQISCDRQKADPSAPSSTTAPTTRPVSILNIDGKAVQFAPSKMIATKQGGGLNVVLSSDDTANSNTSFVFEMRLDVETVEDISSIAWTFKAPNDEPRDSTDGIFLENGRRQLQPSDVKVTFQKQGETIVANIAGEFISFDTQDQTLPVQIVDVDGQLQAIVQEQN